MMGSGLKNSRPPVAERLPRPKAYNPYEGRDVTGAPDVVLSRGRIIIEKGKFVGKAGAGSFLKRNPRS
jgi:dihydroorotase-like cyclic amidohydrolase